MSESTTTSSRESDGIVQGLRTALENKAGLHKSWTTGVATLPESETTLYYEHQDGTIKSLKLGSVTSAQAEDLGQACSPATFGLNQRDVLDESYRKAGKLDVGKFSWLFNPSGRGDFTTQLASGLFPWASLEKGIRFELYKLNVYGAIKHYPWRGISAYRRTNDIGEGSFFKAHQDTPRSGDMFGSLVCLLPIAHEGGDLLLRHCGHDFTFDGQALLHNAPSTSIAWIAFFSDVEHEVTPVTAGHRVTITFNLYYDPQIATPIYHAPSSAAMLEHPFKSALQRVIENPAAIKAHPILGFGLQHAYPVSSVLRHHSLLDLKGADMILIQILRSFGIKYNFFLLYRDEKHKDESPFRILSQSCYDGDTLDADQAPVEYLLKNGGFIVWDRDPKGVEENPYLQDWYYHYKYGLECGDQYEDLPVEWVVEPSEENLKRSVAAAYGNEPGLGYFYHQICVVALLDPDFDSRGLINQDVDAMERLQKTDLLQCIENLNESLEKIYDIRLRAKVLEAVKVCNEVKWYSENTSIPLFD
ncbi:hypothetical protein NP233_g5412 [Leucocoprinus birnbaumii]|uniref:Fe2OG dioxygenase domain-containing protein n=1 Tax=Leucocoprinus birnbaumii TaxID=56174 RepID=A0AAD5VVA1_9AGAR|nr:hypothetical protein NP233_g5412 [Leucocoprinus birnbaumii]